jgi:hypothetical protein
MSEIIPNKILYKISDKIPENLPITKFINIMMGIIRKKNIYFLYLYIYIYIYIFILNINYKLDIYALKILYIKRYIYIYLIPITGRIILANGMIYYFLN